MHKGALSDGTAKRRHEAATSLRHLKRLKQSGSVDLAASVVKLGAQVVTGQQFFRFACAGCTARRAESEMLPH